VAVSAGDVGGAEVHDVGIEEHQDIGVVAATASRNAWPFPGATIEPDGF
jgi:hypothetical protein